MEGNPLRLTCDSASALVPGFLDGELSEEQTSSVRAHLLDCPACREVAKGEQVLKRWFIDEPIPDAPAGFAARVSRRAFAGDPGVLVPVAGHSSESSVLPFVLRLTAAAAALLLMLAATMHVRSRSAGGDELRAEDLDAVWAEIYDLEGESPARYWDDDPAADSGKSAVRDR